MKRLILLMAAVAFSLSSCKKEEKPAETTEPTNEVAAPSVETPAESSEAAVATEGNEITLELGSTDAMKYTKNEFRVPAGSTVTLKLTHEGKLSKESMGHNWVLLKKGTNIQDFAMEAMNAKETNYVPENSEAVIAHTDVVGGGETATVTFTAPEAGTYDFICSFPGHYGSMNGKFIVE